MSYIVTEDGYVLERINSRQLMFSRIDGKNLEDYGKKYLDAYYDMLLKTTGLDDEDRLFLMSGLVTEIKEDQKSIILTEDQLRKEIPELKTDSNNNNYCTNTYYIYCKEGQIIDEMAILSNLLIQYGHDINEFHIEKLLDGKYVKITTGYFLEKKPKPFQKKIQDLFNRS